MDRNQPASLTEIEVMGLVETARGAARTLARIGPMLGKTGGAIVQPDGRFHFLRRPRTGPRSPSADQLRRLEVLGHGGEVPGTAAEAEAIILRLQAEQKAEAIARADAEQAAAKAARARKVIASPHRHMLPPAVIIRGARQ